MVDFTVCLDRPEISRGRDRDVCSPARHRRRIGAYNLENGSIGPHHVVFAGVSNCHARSRACRCRYTPRPRRRIPPMHRAIQCDTQQRAVARRRCPGEPQEASGHRDLRPPDAVKQKQPRRSCGREGLACVHHRDQRRGTRQSDPSGIGTLVQLLDDVGTHDRSVGSR